MTTAAKSEFLITECPTHGTRETSDLPSVRAFVEASLMCRIGIAQDPIAHHVAHVADGTQCWSCCPAMTVDPTNLV